MMYDKIDMRLARINTRSTHIQRLHDEEKDGMDSIQPRPFSGLHKLVEYQLESLRSRHRNIQVEFVVALSLLAISDAHNRRFD